MASYSYRSKCQLFKKMLSCGICILDSQITIRPSCHEKLKN
ncbi:contact-dependent growth inhibition system immunity protein [Photorhabdus thracensis]|nr:contact-dependent growth inhibition system immunity protein [Photorhabdus thracensis]